VQCFFASYALVRAKGMQNTITDLYNQTKIKVTTVFWQTKLSGANLDFFYSDIVHPLARDILVQLILLYWAAWAKLLFTSTDTSVFMI
jgi:hypothetical protein